MALKCTGFIETLGLAAAIEAADTAVKSANVKLIGYEYTKGDGMCTVKVEGDVGAVKAAIAAASISASKVWGVYSTDVIARPAAGIDMLIHNADATIGYEDPNAALMESETKEEVKEESEESDSLEVEEEIKVTEKVSEVAESESIEEVEKEPEPIEEIVEEVKSEPVEEKKPEPVEEIKEISEPIEEGKEEAENAESAEEMKLEEPVEDEIPAEVLKEEVPKDTPKKSNSRRRRRSGGKNPKENDNNGPKNES